MGGLTGNTLLLSRSADGIARGQPKTVGLAAAAILILVAFGLRSLKTGLVAMVPNVVPVLVFFGVLGLGVAPLSLPTSLIGSVALGIAVDDTVHFLVRYRTERAAGASPEEASVRATQRVGRPIVITSVMATFAEGKPMEMVSLYHLDGQNQLVHTHYCAVGNQPTMRFEKTDKPGVIKFDFASGTNMDVTKDGHVHGGTMKLNADGTLESATELWRDGKLSSMRYTKLTRKE